MTYSSLLHLLWLGINRENTEILQFQLQIAALSYSVLNNFLKG
jgi:hypothetical protein